MDIIIKSHPERKLVTQQQKILAKPSAKRMELGIFLLPKWIEIIINFHSERKLVTQKSWAREYYKESARAI